MPSLYTRLAFSGIKRNGQVYLPYWITSVVVTGVFFIMVNLALSPPLAANPSMITMWLAIRLSCVVLAALGAIIIVYAGGHATKARMGEWGVYAVLGFTRKNLKQVVRRELLLHFATALFSGLAAGAVFTRMAFLLMQKLMDEVVDTAVMLLQPQGFAVTLAWAACVCLILYLRNAKLLKQAAPLDILRVSQKGERPPRFSPVRTGLGLAALAAGYGLVLYTQRPTQAIFAFFIAIWLVMFATYSLFTSGSIRLLMGLQKNKAYYRRPQPFVVVSGLLHRMKRNAAGLASLCILACMVLVTVVTTFSLYAGTEDMLRSKAPYDFMLTNYVPALGPESELASLPMEETILEMVARHGLIAKDVVRYNYNTSRMVNTEPGVFITSNSYDSDKPDNAIVKVMLLEDYNKMEGKSETLAAGQALLFTSGTTYKRDTITLNGAQYGVTALKSLAGVQSGRQSDGIVYELIVPTLQDLEQFAQHDFTGNRHGFYFNLQGSEAATETFVEEYLTLHNEKGLGDFTFYQLWKENVRAPNGGFFFLGVFFSGIFLLFSLLILYYKQIAEGYEDRQRFVRVR